MEGNSRLIADIPASLKKEFSKVAQAKETTMTALLKKYIEKEIKSYNQTK